jgi:hypothetical protein
LLLLFDASQQILIGSSTPRFLQWDENISGHPFWLEAVMGQPKFTEGQIFAISA